MTIDFNAVTFESGVTLHLHEDDVAEFNALPPLPEDEPDDFDAPDVIVTDVVTGRTWMVSRFGLAIGSCQCGCAAYAEDITESWEEFLAKEDAAEAPPR